MTENKSVEEQAQALLDEIHIEGELLNLRDERGERVSLEELVEIARRRLDGVDEDVRNLVGEGLRRELNLDKADVDVIDLFVTCFNTFAKREDVPPWTTLGVSEEAWNSILSYVQAAGREYPDIFEGMDAPETWDFGVMTGVVVGYLFAQARQHLGVN